MDEQYEIVRVLDVALRNEMKVKDALIEVLEQIEILKKSILAKAFHGELGTNDPLEESSLEMLKQIIENE